MFSCTVSCRTGPRLPTDFADKAWKLQCIPRIQEEWSWFWMTLHPLKCLLLLKWQISPNFPLNLCNPESNKASQWEWLSNCTSVLTGATPWPTWTCNAILPSAPGEDPVLNCSRPRWKEVWDWKGCQLRSFHWFLFPVILWGKENTQPSGIVRQT